MRDDILTEYRGREDDIPGIFSLMDELSGAIESFTALAERFDTYILSISSWGDPSAWQDKLLQVKQYLGNPAYKRLILIHHKDLLAGDYLVDDRTKHGADRFAGKHIHFPSDRFPDWGVRYLFYAELESTNMDKDAAIAAARAYLSDCIEFEAIPENEVKRLDLYWFSAHLHEFHFFYYRTSAQPLGVGCSPWIAVSRRTGRVAGRGVCGE